MKTYITTLVRGNFVTYPEEIDADYWEGKIGETIYDFYDGKWVLLSEEQAAFHEEHQNASVSEVWNMELNTNTSQQHYIRNLEDAKHEMIQRIKNYDISDSVNSFEVNGISAWFTPQERSNYKNSVESAKLLNIENISFFINDILITIPTTQAEMLLAQLQLYADQCYIVTQQHKSAVEALDTIEAVDNYDYTQDYPSKISVVL